MMQSNKPQDLLRAARKERFKTQVAAALHLNMPEATYRSYENGSRDITIDAARLFQAAFGVDATKLVPERLSGLGFGGSTADVEVIGELAVGLWRDSNLAELDNRTAPPPRITTAKARRGSQRWAYRMADSSINKLIQKGWYAIVELTASKDPLDFDNETLVVIERTRASLTERTIRKIERKSRERCVLTCHSDDKMYAGEKIAYPPKSAEESIIVIGRVVGGCFHL